MKNKLKQVLANVLQINADDINENTSANTIETWDSLGQMNVIVAIEEQFGVEFDEEEIVMLNSYSLLFEFLKNKLNP